MTTDLGEKLARLTATVDLDTSCLDVIMDDLRTRPRITIVTNAIEAPRLRDTELSDLAVEWKVVPWWRSRDEVLPSGRDVGSDRSLPGTTSIAPQVAEQRRILTPHQQDLLRAVSAEAASAATSAAHQLSTSLPDYQAAGFFARELLDRHLDPVVLFAAGDERIGPSRHPLPTGRPLGRRAMLVCCARHHGHIANVTRTVAFGSTCSEPHERLLLVEQAFLDATPTRRADRQSLPLRGRGLPDARLRRRRVASPPPRRLQRCATAGVPRPPRVHVAHPRGLCGRLESQCRRLQGRGHLSDRTERSGPLGARRAVAARPSRGPAAACGVDPLRGRAKRVVTNDTILIDGAWQTRDQTLEVTNPANGSVVGRVAIGRPHDVVLAADAAGKAFDEWADLPARRRADLLMAASELIAERSAGIERLLATEAGKRLPEAVGEISFSAEYFRWFAEQARRPTGQVVPHELPERRHLTIRRPSGVVASLTPWNFPCSIQARKLAPALAAGCTAVARVSEKAPLAVTEMIRCLTDAGVPAGVVNLVHGPAAELIDALLAHPAVRVVSFTGSTQVGRRIMRTAANRVVRPLLELGGDAPFVVFEDADVESAVEGAVLAKFRNTGQSCIGANRFIVHESIYDEFVDRIDAMTVGDGLAAPCPDLGPVIDDARAALMRSFVDEAMAAGASRLTREFDLPNSGSYAAPALLADVPNDAQLARDEVFGPVAGVFRFRDEPEALQRANATEMGLAGYFWSRDVSRCWRMAEKLNVGIVGVNNPLPSVAFTPMGGVKQSGLGREGGDAGLEEFQDPRYVALGL